MKNIAIGYHTAEGFQKTGAVIDTETLETELTATYAPKWKASTAYLAGEAVLAPTGEVVTAKANFTSGASYDVANWNNSAIPATADAGDTQAAATKRLQFTDAAGAKGSMIDLWHWGNGTAAPSQASYGLDIHNGIGAKQALVTHQYSNAAPAWQLDNTDSNDGILVRNALNNLKNPTGTGNGKPFVFNSHGTIRFQIFNKGEVYVNPGPDALGHGIEIVGDTTTNKHVAIFRHNGPQHGVQISSTSTAAGWYSLNIGGWNYGEQVTTSQDGGTTLAVTKNGTGTGSAVVITNKGTGVTVAFNNAAGVLSGIKSDGEYEHYTAGKGIVLKSPNGTRYRITVADGGTIAVAAA